MKATQKQINQFGRGYLTGFFSAAFLFFILFLSCNRARAQELDRFEPMIYTPDSLNFSDKDFMLITPEEAVMEISDGIRSFEKEYRAGWIFAIGGSSLILLSTTIDEYKYSHNDIVVENNPLKQLTLVTGCIASAAGLFLMIDAHKHINRAGRYHLSPLGLVIKIGK